MNTSDLTAIYYEEDGSGQVGFGMADRYLPHLIDFLEAGIAERPESAWTVRPKHDAIPGSPAEAPAP